MNCLIIYFLVLMSAQNISRNTRHHKHKNKEIGFV